MKHRNLEAYVEKTEKIIVISNTSPLINLEKADALYLISKLFMHNKYEVVIPSEVLQEIRQPLKSQIKNMRNSGDITISPSSIKSMMNRVAPIAEAIALDAHIYKPEDHYAEAVVIIKGEDIKLSHRATIILMDEVAAIKIARKKGLRVMNHKDIIVACVEGIKGITEGIISKSVGLQLLETLVSKGVNYRPGMLEHYRNEWS
jgi:predicted nucleic acid-binding protein